jgi:hypothetical protein
MPPSQISDAVIEEKTGTLEDTKKSWAGVGGLGIIALCGLCCSLPLLAGGGLALGGASVLACLGATWPIIAVVVGLAVLATGIVWLRQTSRRNPASLPMTSGETGECSACSLDGSCGCKK